MALDTNWRIQSSFTNRYICSRSGNDGNDGSMASPYRTLDNNPYGARILRGQFNLQNNITATSQQNAYYTGDGFCLINCNGYQISLESVSSSFMGFNNVFLKNASNIAVDDFNFGDGKTDFIKCVFDNCDVTIQGTGKNNSNSQNLFFNNSIIRNTREPNIATKCTYHSVTIIPRFQDFSYCAIGGSTNVNAINATVFTNCALELGTNFSGTLIDNVTLDGEANTIPNIYNDGEKFSGTATIGGVLVTFTNCFYTADMMFNDAANKDYTLQVGSPLINEGNIIGCYGVAIRFDATHPAFQVSNGASINSNITVTGGTFELTSGTTGRVISSPNFATSLELPYFTYLTEAVQFFGGFNYNNGDWIDEANYNASTNPEVRLTYKIRVWDEATSTWGTWYDVENQVSVEKDMNGLGNGDVNADMVNLGAIGGKNFQVDFVIRNNGV